MNHIESSIIKIINRKQYQIYIPDIIDFIQNNNIYSRPSNLNDYNFNNPINRFSSAVEILHKHLINTKFELDSSKSILNHIIPIKLK
jgi:hypothetical protein